MKHSYSAGGIILNENDEVLLIIEDDDFCGFPSGHIEEGESTLEAARREIEEEAGLSKLDLVSMLGEYTRHPFISGADYKDGLKHITMFLFRGKNEDVKPNKEGYKSCGSLKTRQRSY